MFKSLSNTKTLNFLRLRKQFCVEKGKDSIVEFSGADGERYYLRKLSNEDIFEINDAKEVDAYGKGFIYQIKELAIAYFDASKKDFICEYDCENSFVVNNRKDFKTALINYAESYYKLPYKPVKKIITIN